MTNIERGWDEYAPDDTIIFAGAAAKSLGHGKIGGYAVVFGDETKTDASAMRDFFTKETDFGLDISAKGRVLYNHGLDPVLKLRTLGAVDMKVDDVGVWAEGQLALRDAYERKILAMVEAGKLGFSTGTVNYLSRRQAVGSAHKILNWPLGLDVTLAPDPAEPRTEVFALKSLFFDGEAPRAGQTLADHSASVLAAVREFVGRFDSYAAMRRDEGRRVSPPRLDDFKSLASEFDRVLSVLEPKAEPARAAELRRRALMDRVYLESIGNR